MADTNAVGMGGDESSVPLSRIPLFHGLSGEQRSALASKLQRRTVAAGTVILREGEPGEHLFVIVSGGVRVASDDLPDAVFLGRLGPGEFFGETALLRSRVRTAAVIAESDTELLVLSRGDFDELSQAHPDLRYEAERVLRLREAEDGASGQAHDAPSLLALPRAGGAVVSIGRSEENDIVLDDPTVSNSHAQIERHDHDGLVLRDLESLGGTYVNRVRVREAALMDGDAIQIGAAQLFLRSGVLKRYVTPRGVRIEAVSVDRTVGDERILQGVSLAVSPGELVAIVGSSGAGKTTLLRSLLGLHRLDGGEVYYDSAPLSENLDLFRTRLGYVPPR